jgi:hypothetical protein
MYDRGAGVYPDKQRATSLRRRACEFGWAEACPQAKPKGA